MEELAAPSGTRIGWISILDAEDNGNIVSNRRSLSVRGWRGTETEGDDLLCLTESACKAA